MTDLNLVGESYAHSLIAAGKIDKTSPWAFDANDGNTLLGKSGDDWAAYGQVHLGLDRAAGDKTKARYKYPFAKGGMLYRSGLLAIRARAGQQTDGAIAKAAAALLDSVDKPKASRIASGFECKVTAFEYKFLEGDGVPAGTFEGYGSVFNNEDDYGDLVSPGAFTKTLAQYRSSNTMPKMLLNHGGLGGMFASPAPEDLIPVGKWTSMSEDMHGLACKGQLINLDTESGKRLYGAMKEGQLDGLSIGYQAKDFTRGTKENEPRRTLKAIHLIEVSPVTFPANTSALISGIKSRRALDITSIERALRDAGLSRNEAKALLAEGYKALSLRDAETDNDNNDEVVAMIDRTAALLRA